MDRRTTLALSAAFLIACGAPESPEVAPTEPALPPGEPAPPATEPAPEPVVELRDIAPGDLPEWPLAAGTEPTGEPVRVHAVDAPGAWLALALAAPDAAIVAAAPDGRVTGRVSAPSRDAARAALVAAEPALAPLAAPVALRGSGRRVDLLFTDVAPENVLRLLGDVLRRNVVVAPGPAMPHLVLRTRDVPADGVLAAIAAAVAHRAQPESSTTFVLPADGSVSLDRAVLAVRSPPLDVRVSGATPAEVLAVVDAVVPLRHRAPCGANEPFATVLRHERAGVVLAAVALVSGATLQAGDPGAEPCAPPPWTAALPPDGSRVLAAVHARAGDVALVRAPTGEIGLLRATPDLEVRVSDLVRLRRGDETRVLEPAPRSEWRRPDDRQAAVMMEEAADDDHLAATPFRSASLRAFEAARRGRLRLVATILAGERRRALLEEAGALLPIHELEAHDDGEIRVEIDEGVVRIAPSGVPPAELRLRRRAD